MQWQRLRRQSGLTLVELMVAMTISLILLGGVYQLFLGSVGTYKTRDELGRLQENCRYAMDLLAQNVRMAGYPRFTFEGTVFSGDPLAGSIAAAGTASDTIAINYMVSPGDDGYPDDPPPATTVPLLYTVTFSVDPIDRELLRNTQVTGYGASGNQPLIDGVENMQISYGVDADADGSADSYQASPTPPANQFIVAVRIRLLMSTTQELLGNDALDTALYDVNGDGDAEFDPVDDRRLRRIFTTTIALRNVQR